MNFTQQIGHIQQKHRSLLCIGLDPDVEKLPAALNKYRNVQYEFNRRIIDATYDLVCAYKLNIAFYESAGERGWAAIRRTIEYIPCNIISIGDGKRGDIGSTAEQQAKALYDVWGFTASTLQPYMGEDSIAPFIQQPEHGAFILAVTSNDGSKDFQRLSINGKPLYEHVVRNTKKWNTKSNIGLVVGATKPAELKRIRTIAPSMPILIPGIGAQKGDLASAVRYGCDKSGNLAIINIGRSIIYASNGKDFAAHARKTALKYRDEINRYREKYFQ